MTVRPPDFQGPLPSAGGRRLKAALAATAVMCAVAVPLVVALLALSLYFWLRNGGTFGGMGASADQNYHPHLWSTVLMYAAVAAAICADLTVGWLTYRRIVRRVRQPL